MKAKVELNFTGTDPSDAHWLLKEILDRLKEAKVVEDYSFEIEGEQGVVTDRCIFSQGAVVA
jgi:hypothetical protein